MVTFEIPCFSNVIQQDIFNFGINKMCRQLNEKIVHVNILVFYATIDVLNTVIKTRVEMWVYRMELNQVLNNVGEKRVNLLDSGTMVIFVSNFVGYFSFILNNISHNYHHGDVLNEDFLVTGI